MRTVSFTHATHAGNLRGLSIWVDRVHKGRFRARLNMCIHFAMMSTRPFSAIDQIICGHSEALVMLSQVNSERISVATQRRCNPGNLAALGMFRSCL